MRSFCSSLTTATQLEVRFTVESKPFGIAFDTVERDGDVYVVKALVVRILQQKGVGKVAADILRMRSGRLPRAVKQNVLAFASETNCGVQEAGWTKKGAMHY